MRRDRSPSAIAVAVATMSSSGLSRRRAAVSEPVASRASSTAPAAASQISSLPRACLTPLSRMPCTRSVPSGSRVAITRYSVMPDRTVDALPEPARRAGSGTASAILCWSALTGLPSSPPWPLHIAAGLPCRSRTTNRSCWKASATELPALSALPTCSRLARVHSWRIPPVPTPTRPSAELDDFSESSICPTSTMSVAAMLAAAASTRPTARKSTLAMVKRPRSDRGRGQKPHGRGRGCPFTAGLRRPAAAGRCRSRPRAGSRSAAGPTGPACAAGRRCRSPRRWRTPRSRTATHAAAAAPW